jgi:elongation factor 1-alpha
MEEPKMPVDKQPLRLPLICMYKIGGVGTIFGGRVQTGELKVGMMMTFGPTSLEGKVMSVEMHHESGQMALPGDIIVINTQ